MYTGLAHRLGDNVTIKDDTKKTSADRRMFLCIGMCSQTGLLWFDAHVEP